MFTLQQMKAAHAKVNSGTDFPAYVQEIKSLGLSRYEFMVKDGQTVYHGANDFEISSDPIYEEKAILNEPRAGAVREIIAEHQQGKSDFMTFCRLVADAGVEKWVVDTQAMLCSYYDLSGNSMVAEPIPDGVYPSEKLELNEVIWNDDAIIPVEHQVLVNERIKKSKTNPELIQDWKTASKKLRA